MASSQILLEQATRVIPGGVNSPVRSFRAVGGSPVFIKKAKGAYLHSEDGKTYLDFICSWGAMILGHGDERLATVAQEVTLDGLSYGAPTEIEVQMAAKLCHLVPSIEQVRMVNSGTEATMSALRLARGWSGRKDIIKFNGCYHGHSDCLLIKGGSGLLTLSLASSAGVPEELVRNTHSLEFNDCQQVEECFKLRGDEVAAVIVEPIAGNMNFVPADKQFLHTLRQLCDHYGAVLIFDEVMSGFRVAQGGAQAHYGILPDLTCLGKVIGGGMPVGAFGGRQDIMQSLAPLGPVYQAGTLSGNPLVMHIGLAVLNALANSYDELNANCAKLVAGINEIAKKQNSPLIAQGLGGMWGFYCGLEQPPTNFAEVQKIDSAFFACLFHRLLEHGIHLPPSSFEACFLSLAHKQTEVDKALIAFETALQELD